VCNVAGYFWKFSQSNSDGFLTGSRLNPIKDKLNDRESEMTVLSHVTTPPAPEGVGRKVEPTPRRGGILIYGKEGMWSQVRTWHINNDHTRKSYLNAGSNLGETLRNRNLRTLSSSVPAGQAVRVERTVNG
jgi:hypothetical protein